MDLRDLRYFEAIAELQHVGRASAKLHRTQPALTSSVRRLEEDCGVVLFERAGRGIRLTAAGKVLLKWAQRMRFDVEDAKREIAGIGDVGPDVVARHQAWLGEPHPGAQVVAQVACNARTI
jgi:DNA-binding transcriptional LysR family regulator